MKKRARDQKAAGYDVERWQRVPAEPALVAKFYTDLAEELARVLKRLGSFDRALSTLPLLLMSFGIIVFAAGVVLRVYLSIFGSSEFNDMTLFAAVFVLASAATYIAEIRLRDATDLDKKLLEMARQAVVPLVTPPDGSGPDGIGTSTSTTTTTTTTDEGTPAQGA